MARNEKYSFKDFTGKSLVNEPVEDLSNSEIVGSCFYQEWKEGDAEIAKSIFPKGMTGVTFVRCNMDNVLIPDGNSVDGGTNKMIKVQNDGDDWVLDGKGEPERPTNPARRTLIGLSNDPSKIPARKLTESERELFSKGQLDLSSIKPER